MLWWPHNLQPQVLFLFSSVKWNYLGVNRYMRQMARLHRRWISISTLSPAGAYTTLYCTPTRLNVYLCRLTQIQMVLDDFTVPSREGKRS